MFVSYLGLSTSREGNFRVDLTVEMHTMGKREKEGGQLDI